MYTIKYFDILNLKKAFDKNTNKSFYLEKWMADGGVPLYCYSQGKVDRTLKIGN